VNPEETNSILQILIAGTGGLVALAFLLQKFFTLFKTDKTESHIITIMHTELERMSQQNSKLSEELGKLQTEVIELNQQLRNLTLENQALHAEIVKLTAEISKLKELSIVKLKETSWHDQD
jgi:peptidoglycan hydrolase CwlO-like protein